MIKYDNVRFVDKSDLNVTHYRETRHTRTKNYIEKMLTLKMHVKL